MQINQHTRTTKAADNKLPLSRLRFFWCVLSRCYCYYLSRGVSQVNIRECGRKQEKLNMNRYQIRRSDFWKQSHPRKELRANGCFFSMRLSSIIEPNWMALRMLFHRTFLRVRFNIILRQGLITLPPRNGKRNASIPPPTLAMTIERTQNVNHRWLQCLLFSTFYISHFSKRLHCSDWECRDSVRRDLLSLLLHTYPFIHFPRKRWQRSPYKHKLPPHIHLISRVLVVRPTRMATLAQRKIIFIMHCARKHWVYMLEGNTHAARHTVALDDETLLRLLLQPKMRQPCWAEIYFTARHCAVFCLW